MPECAKCGVQLEAMDPRIMEREGGIHGRKYYLCIPCARQKAVDPEFDIR